MMKTSTALIAITCIILAFFSFAYWSVESPAVPSDLLKQIRRGMTMKETENLLGHPRKKTESTIKATSWMYGHPLKWYSLTIDFDSNGKIVSFTHDD